MKKKRRFTAVASAVASVVMAAGQVAVQVAPAVPDDWKHVLLGLHAAAEAIKSWKAFYRNPDGSPAELPWVGDRVQ